jgi:hypothetical protein
MRGRFRLEGYAIVSEDGMIAAADGLMPNSLKFEADLRFFELGLDRAAVIVNGRLSYEGQPNSAARRRLIVTRTTEGVSPDPENPNARLWNPAGASIEEACAALGVRSGMIAAIGGPIIFSLFLRMGYDAFYLSRAPGVRLPDGVPAFSEQADGRSPEEVLAGAGLVGGPPQPLGEGVTMVEWTPRG